MEWLKQRFMEPSSYAAVGAAVMGIGIIINVPLLALAGIIGGIAGFILKEKGII